MHPTRWLGLRRENLNSSRRDYTPGTPLGVGPARVQELVMEHLLPLPLGLSQWGRKELLRLGPDEDLTLPREQCPLLTSKSWTMGTLSPWTYEDDANQEVFFSFFAVPPRRTSHVRGQSISRT